MEDIEEFDNEEQTKFQSFFVEAKEVDELIEQLARDLEPHLIQQKTEGITKILEKYQEQGQLLDPHLECMISKLTAIAEQLFGLRESNLKHEGLAHLRQSLFKILYVFTKVRGYKTILKQFPHELSDLEPLFDIYTTIPKDEWETRYILLLWLSLIVMNPFPFSVVDVAPDSEASLTSRMICEAKNALAEPGKSRDGASIFLSRLLTRHDLSNQLIDFLQWTSSLSSCSDPFLKAGVYSTLVDVFKIGKREDLLDKIDYILPFAVVDSSQISNTLLRQLSVKLAQRIGLIYLKPHVVSWRYQKGRKSLLHNLGHVHVQHVQENNFNDEEDFDIPEQIEEIIGKLLNGLRDKDTIVRWSSAKGIGRITMRLPKHLGDDVVGSVLELFSSGEGDSAWHGGCLALAELARRGLLLPERLDTVVPVIQKALAYDERKGAHSVGSHVRDSACYVCWAFARAYAPSIMAPYVFSLAEGLLKTAVFDREVNCRRAAAAAFQENVGRQGNFPHGIDILTKADYFTLCNRTNAYLDVSYFIAQYPEYCRSLINHLVKVQIGHWDKQIRELTSQTLHKLCDRDVPFMVDIVLPELIPQCFSGDLNTRHGALLATSELMLALYNNGYIFGEEMQAELREVIPTIEAKRLYKGRGGETIREGVCKFIECLSLSKIPLYDVRCEKTAIGSRILKKNIVSVLQETLDTNLKHPSEDIIQIAVRAFKTFVAEYYQGSNVEFGRGVAFTYINVLRTDSNPASRRGYALALGSLPKSLVDAHMFKTICALLVEKVKIEPNSDVQDAESRRNAVLGLINLCETMAVGEDGVNSTNVELIFQAFLNGVNDYAIDKRGDIGSLVREAAMQALQRWAFLLCSSELGANQLFTKQMATDLLSSILKQAVEKIDRVRDHAGIILKTLLFSQNPIILNIPHKESLKNLISSHEANAQLIDWSSPETSFPIFVKCLDYDEYRCELMSGLVISVGGLSSHVFKSSAEALIKYLKDATKAKNEQAVINVCESLQIIMQRYQSDDRVIVPLLKALANLLSHNCLDMMSPDRHPFTEQVISSIITEVRQTKNISKAFICVDVLCELIRFENPTRSKALQRILVSGLQSKFPKAREYAGQQLYGALQILDDIVDDDKLDDIFDILASNKWTDQYESIMPKVEKLYELFGVPKIMLVKKTAVRQ